jgi:hypothetical protein
MSVVRPEFGPTLPELVGPRLRALPRPAQLTLAAVGAVAVVALAWFVLVGPSDGTKPVVINQPVAFNFVYRAPLAQLAPRAGELARVGGAGQTFAVRPLHTPAYRGDSAGMFPIYATHLADQMAAQYPGFLLRWEGRANVNQIQGYEIGFQAQIGGKLTYGRRILLLPTGVAREGVDVLLLAPRDPVVIPRADAIGRNGALKTSLRSFRFGTDRP